MLQASGLFVEIDEKILKKKRKEIIAGYSIGVHYIRHKAKLTTFKILDHRPTLKKIISKFNEQ